MKAKVNENGDLLIERNGAYHKQYCPFRLSGNECGDWCPLFDEHKSEFGDGNLVIIGCGNSMHEIVSDERKARP